MCEIAADRVAYVFEKQLTEALQIRNTTPKESTDNRRQLTMTNYRYLIVGGGTTAAAAVEEIDPKEALLESAPESDRWNPVAGSAGHKVRVSPSADEDDEGRSDNERLVAEGIKGAEHDQMRQANMKREQI